MHYCLRCGCELMPENQGFTGRTLKHVCTDCYDGKRHSPNDGPRYCTGCGVRLTDDNWYACLRKRGRYQCKKCNSLDSMACAKRHPEATKKTNRAFRRRMRERVLMHYGGECACCGENRMEFLAIDHIFGGGLRHVKAIKKRGLGLCEWIIKNNFPTGLRVLCHNCNMSIGCYGYCAHNNEARWAQDAGK